MMKNKNGVQGIKVDEEKNVHCWKFGLFICLQKLFNKLREKVQYSSFHGRS